MAKKMNFKGIIGNVVTGGLTAVGVQVVAKAIEGDVDATTGKPKNEMVVNAALLIGGAALPELVKGNTVSQIGAAAMAIGAYRLADSYDIANKLGINGLGAAKDFAAVGNYGSWSPKRTVKANKVNSVKPTGNAQ